jgi:hypothetical protein
MGVIPRLNRFRVLLDKKKELDGGHPKVEQIPSFTNKRKDLGSQV